MNSLITEIKCSKIQNSLLPSSTLLAHSQHSCAIKLINLPMWKAKCYVFIVPTYDFNIWPWFTLSYLFHVAACLSLFERGSLDIQKVIFTLFNLFITLGISRLCFSSTNPPWLWWDEDGDNASKWTSDPGVPGWQWPSSWHRVVQGWGQTAGTGSEEIKIGTGQRISLLWLTLGLFILPTVCSISWVGVSSDWQGVSTWRYRKSGQRTAAITAVWLPT